MECSHDWPLEFHQLTETTFRTRLHSDLTSLRAAWSRPACRLCTTIGGMIQHRKFWEDGLAARATYLGPGSHSDKGISLVLYLNEEDEDLDDWEYIENADPKNDVQYVLNVHHPFGKEELRICNPEVFLDHGPTTEDLPTGAGKLFWGGSSPAEKAMQQVKVAAAELARSGNSSTGSDESIALASSWLKFCSVTHHGCWKSTGLNEFRPTRLLDVSKVLSPLSRIYLVDFEHRGDSTNLPQQPEYVTLSHRWKPGTDSVTLSTNVKQFVSQGKPMSDLTPTFADACVLTAKLGFKFLWIDSLCIIQDSASDKETEIPKMADYYGCAEFNIVASAGNGLFQSRDGSATSPFSLSIVLNQREVDLRVAPVLRTPKSELEHRAWILQERVLPIRSLFFDAYFVSFECSEMSGSESCPEGVEHSTVSPTNMHVALGTDTARDCTLGVIGGAIRKQVLPMDEEEQIDSSSKQRLISLWYRVVEEFSLRQLSFEHDRLDAVAGLAKRLSGLLKDQYIGGLWKGNLVDCLQWHAPTSRGRPIAFRQASYRAPTWSWASLTVEMVESIPSGVFTERQSGEPLVTVVDVQWEPVSILNKFGSLSSAKLTLHGRPLRGHVYRSTTGPKIEMDRLTQGGLLIALPEYSPRDSYESKVPVERRFAYGVEKNFVHFCGATSDGQRAKMIFVLDPDIRGTGEVGTVYVLPLGEQVSTPTRDVFCLVLKEVGGVFERIGSARTQAKYLPRTRSRDLVLV